MRRTSFTIEFLFRASPTIVYTFLSAPDCLVRWFCDSCDLVDDTYYFGWDGSEEVANIIQDIEEEQLTLQWEDYEGEFLDFKLSRAEITGETILEITAFCDANEALAEKKFWQSKIEEMRRAMGV